MGRGSVQHALITGYNTNRKFPEQWLKRHREAGSSTLGLPSARVEHTQPSSRHPAQKGSRAGDTPTRNVSQDHAHIHTRRDANPQRPRPFARAGHVLDTPGRGLDTPAGVLDIHTRVFAWRRDSSATLHGIGQCRAVQRRGRGHMYPQHSTRVTSEDKHQETRTRNTSRESRPKKSTKVHEPTTLHTSHVRTKTRRDTSTHRFTRVTSAKKHEGIRTRTVSPTRRVRRRKSRSEKSCNPPGVCSRAVRDGA